MNIYVVTEGKAESIIFKTWIPEVNPALTLISSLADVNQNNFFIFSARGYPAIFSAIENAIEDMQNFPQFDRLVISVDSEELTKQERLDEMNSFLDEKAFNSDVRVVIQHFCIEAWALGNRRIIRKHSINERLRSYRKFFDVRQNDPELLPNHPKEELTKAQFAKKYLKLVLNDRRKSLSYSEGSPYPVTETYYFQEIKRRHLNTGHINSFSDFLAAFI